MSRFPSRIVPVGVALAALLLGVALGSRFRSAPPEPASAPPAREAGPRDSDEMARLKRALDHERGLRGALELELALLRREIEPDPGAPTTPARPAEPATPSGAATAKEGVDAAKDAKQSATAHGEGSASNEWFDASKLTEAGVDERRAEWLRERFESLQMDELYLRDQAARGRWMHKPRYSRELRALREETRTEIGDEDYDYLLYGSGRHNRVLLSDVLQNSPAADAGVRAGDVLVRYDDRPIYDVRDLLAETASGELGETASIEVLRDGEVVRLYVPRGPLGARIQPMTRAPSAGP